jgi:hypothetical protein
MDYQEHADELEAEVDSLHRQGERVEQEIAHTREDWKRKQADPAVPGADEPDDDQLDRERQPEARPPG